MCAVIKSIGTLFVERALRVVAPWMIVKHTRDCSDHVFDTGLQIKKSPPISVPFRFFLTAPIFLLLAASVLLWRGPEVMQYRLSSAALAVTHLFTLGFMSMAMLGALLQLLPVVAAAPVVTPRWIGATSHVFVTAGTLFLSAGFLFTESYFVGMGMLLLIIGFAVFILAVGAALLRSPIKNPLVRSIKISVTALALTITFGAVLALSHAWNIAVSNEALQYLHPAWGLVGWGALLAIGVAFRVVPMFQLTPRYPSWLTRFLPTTAFALLVLWSIALWTSAGTLLLAVRLCAVGLAGVLGIFAIATLMLQYRRKGGRPDVTVYFWTLGMVSVLIGILAFTLRIGLSMWSQQFDRIDNFIGIAVLLGFFGSIINGMLYKIVPFLTWFRLHSVRAPNRRVPDVKTIIPERRQRLQLTIQIAALALLGAAALWPPLVYPAALALAFSAIALEANCLGAIFIVPRPAIGPK